jgi:hypothetical protein
VTVNGTEAFVDPISYVIKSAGSPAHCNDIAPPRYRVGGKWYCSHPDLRECHDPAMLPVDEVKINPMTVNNIGSDKSIYTKEQMEEFATSKTAKGPGRPTWQRPLNCLTWVETRRENGAKLLGS